MKRSNDLWLTYLKSMETPILFTIINNILCDNDVNICSGKYKSGQVSHRIKCNYWKCVYVS